MILSCSVKPLENNLDTLPNQEGLAKKVDSIVIHHMRKHRIPGLSIGLVKDHSIIYNRGYGLKNIEKPDQVTDNTIFHTASISKLFTAEAAAKLISQGIISLDDKLVNIIPEIKYSDQRVEKITLKHLMNHTSGLSDIKNYHWGNNNHAEKSLEDFVLELNLKVDFEPASAFQYSNLGYNILGHVIQKVSGTNFDVYMKENFLRPNGMETSDFRYFMIPDTLRISPHSKRWLTNSIFKSSIYPYSREHAPSSTLNASAKELGIWMVHFLQSVSEEKSDNLYHKMIEPSTEVYSHIGLGFQLFELDSYKVVGHYGGDQGFRSLLMMFPNENMGLVLLANCDYEEDFRQEILFAIAGFMLKADQE
jgi:CubicO group peptidase (beta-lactamase class C family)